MPTSKTIKLLEPFEHHNDTISEVELREPSGGLYAQLGEPRIVVRNADGGYYVEQADVIKKYLDKLIAHQDGSILLGLMSLPDVMALKEALFGFFLAAEVRLIAQRADTSSSA